VPARRRSAFQVLPIRTSRAAAAREARHLRSRARSGQPEQHGRSARPASRGQLIRPTREFDESHLIYGCGTAASPNSLRNTSSVSQYAGSATAGLHRATDSFLPKGTRRMGYPRIRSTRHRTGARAALTRPTAHSHDLSRRPAHYFGGLTIILGWEVLLACKVSGELALEPERGALHLLAHPVRRSRHVLALLASLCLLVVG
jgi:hypothetical protein